ncbi:MAG: hypothetical protein ACTSQA_06055 [Candidatus Heimdallarchaeaceae archaeon]
MSKFTKKHFVLVADILRNLKGKQVDEDTLEKEIKKVIPIFKQSNPDFDEKKFRAYIKKAV